MVEVEVLGIVVLDPVEVSDLAVVLAAADFELLGSLVLAFAVAAFLAGFDAPWSWLTVSPVIKVAFRLLVPAQ